MLRLDISGRLALSRRHSQDGASIQCAADLIRQAIHAAIVILIVHTDIESIVVQHDSQIIQPFAGL